MRTVRIWFRKIGTTRFISHLDLTRCMSRRFIARKSRCGIRRALTRARF